MPRGLGQSALQATRRGLMDMGGAGCQKISASPRSECPGGQQQRIDRAPGRRSAGTADG